jgi:hypothetical protein
MKVRIVSPARASRLRTLLSSPWVPAGLAPLAPLAGVWVTSHADVIRAQINRLIPDPTWTLFAIPADFWVFVIMLAVMGCGFAAHKWAEAAGTADRQARLEGNIRVVATLGLERAAARFRTSVAKSYPLSLLAFKEQTSHAELAQAIKGVLGGLAEFVKELDQAPVSSRYQCSLFLFHAKPSASGPDPALAAVPKLFPTYWPAELAGVLELRPELSTADDAKPCLLPLPSASETLVQGRMRPIVWPGAAYSAAKREYQIFRSIRDVREWCDKANYSDGLKEEIDRYFSTGDGKGVKSFATLPVEVEERVVGVISIERSTPGLLPAERHQIFVPIVTPLILYTAQLLLRYRSLPPPAPAKDMPTD